MMRLLAIMGGSTLATVAASPRTPLRPSGRELVSRPCPAASYDDAVARIRAIAAHEATLDLQPEGRSIALLTGAPTPRAVVLFHGYTNVPEQFRLVGEAYRAQGWNVWIPRLPYHGSADRMTTGFSHLTARGLRAFADASVDIGAGLGEELTVAGHSGGGGLAMWAGFERADVERAVLISPLMHPIGYSDRTVGVLIRALRASPVDRWNWWNEDLGAGNCEGYDYARFSLKGIAALLTLPRWLVARERPPLHARVTLVRNDGDPRLDGARTEASIRRLVPDDRLRVVTIPADEGLGHDLVAWEPHSECRARLGTAYRYLSEALEIPIPDPAGKPAGLS